MFDFDRVDIDTAADNHVGNAIGDIEIALLVIIADFTQREDEMLPRLFEEAGMRQTVDGGVIVLQGRNVGGSTVHNLCYAFRTPPGILAMWREEHGLPELTDEALAGPFERVEAFVG